VALLCSGGSTNHTMHWVAIARSAGIVIDWDDFNDLSAAVPLLTRIYPNGPADINEFHAAGGTPFLIRTLLEHGYLHDEVETVVGKGLAHYTQMPELDDGATTLVWQPAVTSSRNAAVLRGCDEPFAMNGGLRVMQGNLGRGVIKVSAVAPSHWTVEAPARIFHDQDALAEAFERGELQQDMVAVVRFQGPVANGMPELHKLTPYLGILQDRGFRVALLTDGRMSGASGKVPAVIHVYPEAALGGPLAKLRDGDIIRLDAVSGALQVLINEKIWQERIVEVADLTGNDTGSGRELFSKLRRLAGHAEAGASFIFDN
jgi:phosphogluconate dehydratase